MKILKSKLKKVKVKKLYMGHVSIRDYIVEKSLEKQQGIIINFNDRKMTIPLERLKVTFQIHKQKFQSKFSEKKYELLDFEFIPDDMNRRLK